MQKKKNVEHEPKPDNRAANHDDDHDSNSFQIQQDRTWLRPALELDIEGIKSWALKRFPHQIFYEIQNDHVELWRILHPRRDINQATLSRQRFQ